MSTYTDDEIREHRKLWTEALRSGAYRQARGTLEREGAYCCLGVACIVAEQHGVPVTRTSTGKLWGHVLQGRQRAVSEWLGLDNGLYSGGLTSLNDGGGASFDYIANYIEERTP